MSRDLSLFGVMIIVYIALVRWLLPRLGVPT
jgi:hypothetical protein